MRRPQCEAKHKPPYLDDLIVEAREFVRGLADFDMGCPTLFTREREHSLKQLWDTFEKLSCRGRSRDGRTGVVGISKAVLLLTEGRIGPAFDSNVRNELGIRVPESARDWIIALRVVAGNIQGFEVKNCCTLKQAAPPQFTYLHCGRIYDMALGPRGTPAATRAVV